MVNHIKPLLDKFIGPHRIGFFPRRQILDVVMTTYEAIHSMERRNNPSMAFKLDISKAYDKVRREFLFYILPKIGFNENFIRIIKVNVNTITFPVLVNGAPRRFFFLSRFVTRRPPITLPVHHCNRSPKGKFNGPG